MRVRGFTLLELLVTVAIVTVLAALALPGHGAVVQRAQRNDARLALLAIQHAEELHYQNANAYSALLAEPAAEGGLGMAASSEGGQYSLEVTTRDAGQHFTATARSKAGGRQATDRACASFTIDDTGHRTASDAAGNDSSSQCWR